MEEKSAILAGVGQTTVRKDHAHCVELVKSRDREGYRKFIERLALLLHIAGTNILIYI